jgi:hypothetical protein
MDLRHLLLHAGAEYRLGVAMGTHDRSASQTTPSDTSMPIMG